MENRRGTPKHLCGTGGGVNPGKMAFPDMPRTDLACEAGRPAARMVAETVPVGGQNVTVTRCLETDGHRYVTVACGRITGWAEEELPLLADILSREIEGLAESVLGGALSGETAVLVAGLGNAAMTADSVGPGTVRRLTVTRHLRALDPDLYRAVGCCSLSALAPGVLGETGMESGELIRGAVDLCRPDLVIAVDALAARSCERLASTFQLSDSGLAPGAGIGNHRMAVNRDTMGCPVLSLGVPTVVDSATLVWDALTEAGLSEAEIPPRLRAVLEEGRSFIVSPRDADSMAERSARVLAGAIDRAVGIARGV